MDTGTVTVRPVHGLYREISVPGDKSISHRAIILGSIAEGDTVIDGLLEGEDNLRTLEGFKAMGVEVEGPRDGHLIIHGRGLYGLREPGDVIDAGNSGTTIRLLTGLLSGQPFFSVITGDDSLRRRPMKRVVEPLTHMGARVYGRKGGELPPLAILGGGLKPIAYTLSIPSAQVKSAILLAGLYADGVTSIEEPTRSRDHTERMLKAFGVQVSIKGCRVEVKGRGRLLGQSIRIPGDISSASFFIVAALITPGTELLIKGVGVNPTRTGVIDILKKMGGDVVVLNQREVSGEPVADILAKSSSLNGVEISGDDIVRAIDEFPILTVAASVAEGNTVIKGASELRVKESDRVSTMATELTRLGAKVKELEDGMVIEGVKGLKGSRVTSHGDHRVAMSLVVAGLIAKGETVVEDIDCIDTSFPGFMGLLAKVTGR